MKSSDLMKIVTRLGYVEVRRKGSHRHMTCNGRLPLTFAFHDGQTIPPGLVKKVLTKDVGLTNEQIIDLLK